tara:strand:+ start:565 stop:918 length:354 start_codon:yes stop_codon:yes gene_type:complete
MKTEHEEQRDLVSWFRQQYRGVKIYAIPNGGKRNRITGARLKAEGALAGVSDLHVPAWNLWIEMKREKGGKLSPAQRSWGGYVESIGHTFIVGHGFKDAADKIIKLRCLHKHKDRVS